MDITYLLENVLDVIKYIILWGDLSLNNTLKLQLAVFKLILMENTNYNFFFGGGGACQFRWNSGHCSHMSHIWFFGTWSLQESGVWNSLLSFVEAKIDIWRIWWCWVDLPDSVKYNLLTNILSCTKSLYINCTWFLFVFSQIKMDVFVF